MIYRMADGDITKYEWIENNCDISDFFKWISFKNRDNEIEKYMMDNPDDDNNNNTANSFTTTDPMEALKFFEKNKK